MIAKEFSQKWRLGLNLKTKTSTQLPNPFRVPHNTELLFLNREKERTLRQANSKKDLCVWDKEIANRIDRVGIIRKIREISDTNKMGNLAHKMNLLKQKRKKSRRTNSLM